MWDFLKKNVHLNQHYAFLCMQSQHILNSINKHLAINVVHIFKEVHLLRILNDIQSLTALLIKLCISKL